MLQSLSSEANRPSANQNNSPRFMEPEGSLLHSQEPTTCAYPEPDQSCSRTYHFHRTCCNTQWVEVRNFVKHFVTLLCFSSEELLAPRPTPKLEFHTLSAAHNWLFHVLAATLHICKLLLYPHNEDAPRYCHMEAYSPLNNTVTLCLTRVYSSTSDLNHYSSSLRCTYLVYPHCLHKHLLRSIERFKTAVEVFFLKTGTALWGGPKLHRVCRHLQAEGAVSQRQNYPREGEQNYYWIRSEHCKTRWRWWHSFVRPVLKVKFSIRVIGQLHDPPALLLNNNSIICSSRRVGVLQS